MPADSVDSRRGRPSRASTETESVPRADEEQLAGRVARVAPRARRPSSGGRRAPRERVQLDRGPALQHLVLVQGDDAGACRPQLARSAMSSHHSIAASSSLNRRNGWHAAVRRPGPRRPHPRRARRRPTRPDPPRPCPPARRDVREQGRDERDRIRSPGAGPGPASTAHGGAAGSTCAIASTMRRDVTLELEEDASLPLLGEDRAGDWPAAALGVPPREVASATDGSRMGAPSRRGGGPAPTTGHGTPRRPGRCCRGRRVVARRPRCPAGRAAPR